MKIISDMFKSIYHILGHQRYDPNETYRLSPYLITHRNDDGSLICYNTLTREIVLLSSGEVKCRQFLVEHWYLIPEYTDPGTICYLMLHQHRNQYGPRPVDGLQRVTILTTTECNARCWYCYESGCRKRTMTPETALDVAKFIEKRGSKGGLTIKWFGGEPLCNSIAINTICQYLKDQGVEYRSMIVTNGLLFRDHSIDEIMKLWRLYSVQITLDGNKDLYERTKSYINADNAFECVLDNISMLLKAKIHVDVRLNLSKDNYKELMDLTDYLSDRFGSYGGGLLTVYSHTLFEGDGFSLNDKERKQLYKQDIELQERLKNYGIGGKHGIPKIKHTHCMADEGNSVVVMPEGELGLCEHHCDDEYIGTIYDEEWNQEIIQSWKDSGMESKECIECFWRPSCNRLKKCSGKTPCTESWRAYLKEKARIMMKNAYQRYLKRVEIGGGST